MASVLARPAQIPRLSRFGWLMGLYSENHARLARLFAVTGCAPGRYLSRTGDGIDLQLDVVAQHRYTSVLRLSYAMTDPLTGEPDPSAHLRLYHDANQLEATHCYIGRRWQDVLGMYPPPAELVNHRLRMNTFLGKWLEYLSEGGHGSATLRWAPVAAAQSAETLDGPARRL